MTEETEPGRPPGGARRASDAETRGAGGTGGADGTNGTGGGADGGRDGSPDAGPARPRLTRGRDKDKVVAGVCHGAGLYFGVDPVIFRVVLSVLSLTGGIGLIIYGLGWLVVPQEGERESEAHRLLSGRIEGAPLTAVLIALVGCGLYASMIGNGANQAFSLLLLAATAGAVYWSQQRRRLEEAGEMPAAAGGAGGATRAPGTVPDAPPAAVAPPEPGGAPSWWREPLSKEPSYLWGPDDGPYQKEDRRAWKERSRAGRRPEGRTWLFSLVVLVLALAALGAGTGAAWAYQPLGAALEIGLAAMLGVVGVAFVVASVAGRAQGGTVFWSVVILAALIGAATLPKSGQGVGDSTWRPVSAASVQPSYARGAGKADLDLSGLRLARGEAVRTTLTLGIGQAVVRVPDDAVVHLVYRVKAGDVVLPGKDHSGVDMANTGAGERLTLAPAAGAATAVGTLDLDLTVGFGELEVIR
jgi:phage shock protein PspC (stress-responsive transcriptional regulator)